MTGQAWITCSRQVGLAPPLRTSLSPPSVPQIDDVRSVRRHDFCPLAAAHLIPRTGQIRSYGTVVPRKGVVMTDGTWRC